MVRTSIRDARPRIPVEQLSKVFEPFFTTKDVGIGTGLGLSGSLRILSQYECRIWAESFGESGTTFQIELPVADGIDTQASTNDPDAFPTTVGSTYHEVVVDDELHS